MQNRHFLRPLARQARPLVLASVISAVLAATCMASVQHAPPSTHAPPPKAYVTAAAHVASSDHRLSFKKTEAAGFDLMAAQHLPDGQIQDIYPPLLNRAQSGDLEAKRLLFLVLNQCHTIAKFDEASVDPKNIIDPQLPDTEENKPYRGEARAKLLADFESRALLSAENTLRQCEQLPKGAIGDAARWLTEAAEGGDIYAQLAFGSYIDLVVGAPQEQLKNPEKVRKFNTDTMKYLQGLAARRIPDALYSLSGIYESGIITKKDMVRAYAYKTAYDNIAPINANPRALQTMSKDMTSEQISEAKALAQSLLARRTP